MQYKTPVPFNKVLHISLRLKGLKGFFNDDSLFSNEKELFHHYNTKYTHSYTMLLIGGTHTWGMT